MQDYAFTKHRIFQWMGIILAFGLIAVGYWYYQSQASTTINKNLSDSLSTGLNLYWPLDDGTSGTTPTTATDSSTNGNTGTLTGGPPTPSWTTGQIGSAVDFNGTDHYITVADTDVLDIADSRNFTLSGWFNRDTFTTDDTIIAKANGQAAGDTGYVVYVDDTNDDLVFEISDGTDEYSRTSTSTFTSTGWNHFAAVFEDAVGMTIYINGSVNQDAASGTLGNIGSLANTVAFRAGAESDAGNPFDGKLDDVRLYNRMLSSNEVTELYRLTTPTGVDTGLKGYWTFDGEDVSGTTTYDRSGAGNNGTLTNGPVVARGKIGQAIAFDGINDKVSLTDNAVFDVGGAGSWCNWFYSTANQSSKGMFSHNDGNYVMINGYLTTNSSILGGYVRIGTTAYTATSPAYATGYWNNQWHHVCTTFDKTLSSQRLKVYADGVLVGTHDAANGNVDAGTNPMIGNWVFGGGEQTSFQGSIDDVQMYNRALTAAEIKNLYDKGASDKTNTSAAQPQGTGNFDSGLVAYWRMDDGSGTSATDSSTNGHTGTLTNGPTWTTGQIGGAVDVDGSNDIIDVADVNTLDITNTITLSAWIKKDTSPAFGAYDTVVIKGDSGAPAINYFLGTYSLSGPAERVRFAYYAGGVTHSVHGSTTLSNGTWYHIAAVYNDTTNSFQMYVNGTPETLTTLSGDVANNSMVANAYDMDIGSSNGGSNFDGQIDELRIYSRAFSPEEIADLYRLVSPTGVDTGLKGYWSFNAQDMSGTTAYDRSGAGNTGTLTNSPTKTVGKIGQALLFDGSNDCVKGTATATADIFTYAAWINWTTGTSGTIIGTDFGGIQWRVVNSSGTGYLNLLRSGVGNTGDSSVVIAPGVWTHVAVTNDASGNFRFYMNGVDIGGGTDNYNYVNNIPIIGARYNTCDSELFTGKIDEVRIYNRVLTASEMRGLYDIGQADKSNSSVSQPQGTGRLDSGLAGYWPLDNGSGTSASDLSTNGNTGTLTNGPTWTTGQIGSAVSFDGSNDYVDVSDSTVLEPLPSSMAIAAWVYPTSSGSYPAIVTKTAVHDEAQSKYALYFNGSSRNLAFAMGGTIRYSSLTVPLNQWSLVVASQNSSALTLHLNGASESFGVTSAPSYSTETFKIGSFGPGGPFPGYIDEVRLYNRPLSTDEIANLYRLSTPTGTDTGLKGYWSFNGQDMNGTTAYDRSGAGNTGTLTNGPTKTLGKIGQGIRFDGTNDYVSITDVSALRAARPMSVSAWIKRDAISEADAIFWKRGASNDGWWLQIESNNKITFTFGDIADVSSTATVSDTNWHHIAVAVESGGGITFYLDGVLAGTATIGAPFAGDGTLYLGATTDTNGTLNGYTDFSMDEVRIYNRALSAAEVAGLYNQSR